MPLNQKRLNGSLWQSAVSTKAGRKSTVDAICVCIILFCTISTFWYFWVVCIKKGEDIFGTKTRRQANTSTYHKPQHPEHANSRTPEHAISRTPEHPEHRKQAEHRKQSEHTNTKILPTPCCLVLSVIFKSVAFHVSLDLQFKWTNAIILQVSLVSLDVRCLARS